MNTDQQQETNQDVNSISSSENQIEETKGLNPSGNYYATVADYIEYLKSLPDQDALISVYDSSTGQFQLIRTDMLEIITADGADYKLACVNAHELEEDDSDDTLEEKVGEIFGMMEVVGMDINLLMPRNEEHAVTNIHSLSAFNSFKTNALQSLSLAISSITHMVNLIKADQDQEEKESEESLDEANKEALANLSLNHFNPIGDEDDPLTAFENINKSENKSE